MTTSGLSLDQLYESADGTCLLHADGAGTPPDPTDWIAATRPLSDTHGRDV